MAADPPRERLLRLLRRTSKGARPAGYTMDDSAIWSAHERALVRVRDSGSAAQRIGATSGRQRSTLDALADRAHALSSRAAELHAGFARMIDAFERLGLVALNAGLEGARLGEAEGRQLGLVSDEVRAHAARGGDAARELGTGITTLSADLTQLEATLGQTQVAVAEVTQDAARAAGAASDAESALLDMGERVKKTTGSDPEAVRALAEAAEHARLLMASLGAVSNKVPRALLVGALRPVLEPLARLLADEGEREAEPERG